MKSWPVTYAMFACQTVFVGLVIHFLRFSDLAAAALYIVSFFFVVAVSKRPEFQGLPGPEEHHRS